MNDNLYDDVDSYLCAGPDNNIDADQEVNLSVSSDADLNDIAVGERAVIKELKAVGSMRRRLLDIGFIENTIVQCLGRSPGGDPRAFLVRGAVIAVRSEDCKDIKILKVQEGLWD